MTREADAVLAAALGADMIGVVLWPGSPRAVSPARARAIGEALPAGVTRVGVFVNQPLEDVRAVCHDARLDVAQLHGDESPAYAAALDVPVIKVFAVTGSQTVAIDDWPDTTLLIDAHDARRRGGTGQLADWTLAAAVARRRRVLLAGGLTPDNVRAAIDRVRPWGVDVASGVESAPGIKDPDRLRAFVAAARTGGGGA